IWRAPRVRFRVLPGPGIVRFSARVLSPQWWKSGMVNVPLSGPPPPMVKPGCELIVTLNGLVSQLLPIGTLRPKMLRLVSFSVTVEVLVIVFVLRLAVPVAGPSWIISLVAVTGMTPNSLAEIVDGGRDRVAVCVPVVRSTAADRVPAPRLTVVFSFLMNVVPVSA